MVPTVQVHWWGGGDWMHVAVKKFYPENDLFIKIVSRDFREQRPIWCTIAAAVCLKDFFIDIFIYVYVMLI